VSNIGISSSIPIILFFTNLHFRMESISLGSGSGFVRDSKGISRDLIGILFGSRSLLTERDPKEFRTSSEGDPNKCRIKPLGETIRQQTKDNRKGKVERGE